MKAGHQVRWVARAQDGALVLAMDGLQQPGFQGLAPLAQALLQLVGAELKRLGGVRPPREFVLMDRAAIGLGSVFLHLKADMNWHRLFRGLVEDGAHRHRCQYMVAEDAEVAQPLRLRLDSVPEAVLSAAEDHLVTGPQLFGQDGIGLDERPHLAREARLVQLRVAAPEQLVGDTVEVVADAGPVCEEVLDGDAIVDERKIVTEDRAHTRIEGEVALFDEAHHHQRGECLVTARDRKLRVGRHLDAETAVRLSERHLGGDLIVEVETDDTRQRLLGSDRSHGRLEICTGATWARRHQQSLAQFDAL